jgi:hypothetical protein
MGKEHVIFFSVASALLLFSFDEVEAAVTGLWDGYMDIPGLETISLSSLDAKLEALQQKQDAAEKLLQVWARVAPEHDPGIEKLRHVVQYYDTMHDQLEEMRADVARSEGVQESNLPERRKLQSEARIRNILAHIQTSDGMTLSAEDARRVESARTEVEQLFNRAQPGTVLYTDTEGKFGPKGSRFWYPLEGGVNPLNPDGPKLPHLLSFKYVGASQLPLSTSRSLYDLQLTLNDRMTLTTPLGEVIDPKSNPFVTAGASDAYDKHARFGGHSDLSAIDFRAIDTTPAGVAEVLADSAHVRNTHVWYEIPGSKNDPRDIAVLTKFRGELVQELTKHGYSTSDAEEFAKKHTRLVAGANLRHYHCDTFPRPPILAPVSLIASK